MKERRRCTLRRKIGLLQSKTWCKGVDLAASESRGKRVDDCYPVEIVDRVCVEATPKDGDRRAMNRWEEGGKGTLSAKGILGDPLEHELYNLPVRERCRYC
jgi:hypothetical protein